MLGFKICLYKEINYGESCVIHLCINGVLLRLSIFTFFFSKILDFIYWTVLILIFDPFWMALHWKPAIPLTTSSGLLQNKKPSGGNVLKEFYIWSLGRVSFFPFVNTYASYPVSRGITWYLFFAKDHFGPKEHLLQKLPRPRDFTKSVLDSCPNHLFPTSPAK